MISFPVLFVRKRTRRLLVQRPEDFCTDSEKMHPCVSTSMWWVPGDTLHALETGIALIVGEENAYRFGECKQWEADFLRHLLGHTTFEEEHDFTEKSQLNCRLCDDFNSTEVRIGKKLTALLGHGSPLKKDMYPNGAVEMKLVFDCCAYYANPAQQFKFGRQFAAFIHATTSNVMLLRSSWAMIGFWAEICCPGRFTLDALQDTQQE